MHVVPEYSCIYITLQHAVRATQTVKDGMYDVTSLEFITKKLLKITSHDTLILHNCTLFS